MKRILLLALPLLACAGPGYEPLAERQEIVGGEEVFPNRFRAVGALAIPISEDEVVAFCTGTLITPRVVLTAAHCLLGTSPEDVSFVIGLRDDLFERVVPVKSLTLSSHFDISNLPAGNDIALMELAEELSDVSPIPFNRDPLGPEFLGKTFTAVGFGVTGDGAGDGGVKRAVELSLSGLDEELLFYGTATANICSGDSGGPDLMDFDGELRVIGVHSFVTASASAPFCHNLSASQRTDVQAQRFLDPALATFESLSLCDGPDCEGLDFAGGAACAVGGPEKGAPLPFLLALLALLAGRRTRR